MDLREIIKEIIPWVILLGLWIPALKNVIKKRRENTSRHEPQNHPHDIPFPESAKEFFRQVIPPPMPEKAVRPQRKKSKPVQAKPVANPAPLPEEGTPAIELRPMAPVESAPRATGARRELRRALLLGEILQRTY